MWCYLTIYSLFLRQLIYTFWLCLTILYWKKVPWFSELLSFGNHNIWISSQDWWGAEKLKHVFPANVQVRKQIIAVWLHSHLSICKHTHWYRSSCNKAHIPLQETGEASWQLLYSINKTSASCLLILLLKGKVYEIMIGCSSCLWILVSPSSLGQVCLWKVKKKEKYKFLC